MSKFLSHYDDEQWAPVADLMAAIMLVFMLVAMILFVQLNVDKLSSKEQCEKTFGFLDSEFKNDFITWGAELKPDLSIHFTKQNVLFREYSSDIRHDAEEGSISFADTLRKFFPRYMEIIKDKIPEQVAKDEVLEIRIEGHTSSGYKNLGKEAAYIKNMELSQDRARKILEFVLDPEKIEQASDYGETARQFLTANGLSSSQRICEEGEEKVHKSRRVEFKLRTKSCQNAGRYKEDAKESLAQCSTQTAQS